VDLRGASAGFLHRNARCLHQRAFPYLAGPTRGEALGHHGTSPALAMSGAFSVTPCLAPCTAPSRRHAPTSALGVGRLTSEACQPLA
jgi:hypothetical protein